eukprot:2184824-Rhodomonas_salina.1
MKGVPDSSPVPSREGSPGPVRYRSTGALHCTTMHWQYKLGRLIGSHTKSRCLPGYVALRWRRGLYARIQRLGAHPK